MALAGGIDVSIRAHAGSFVLDAAFQTGPGATAILGESGAGKSLTLRAIAGLLRPDSGRISVRGATVFDSDARVDVPIRRRRLGYVFQDYALFPHLTVRRNLAFGLRGVPRDEAQRTVARVAELLEIGELLDRMPGQLSGGNASGRRWGVRSRQSRTRCCSTSRSRRSTPLPEPASPSSSSPCNVRSACRPYS